MLNKTKLIPNGTIHLFPTDYGGTTDLNLIPALASDRGFIESIELYQGYLYIKLICHGLLNVINLRITLILFVADDIVLYLQWFS